MLESQATPSDSGAAHPAGVIALDVGGTSVKSALLEAGGRVRGEPVTTPINSQAEADVIWNTLAEIVRRHAAELGTASLAGVGCGFPGPFDYAAGISYIRGVAKYDAIYGLNVRAALSARLWLGAAPLLFRNDAEAAIVGEARYGSGRRHQRLIGLTLGTGLGSAFVSEGMPVTQGPGVPQNQGWLYPELFSGEQADDVFSARGLAARLQRVGLPPSASAAAVLARQGDAAARQTFETFGADLGAFLDPFARAFGAQAILVLGGLANAFDLFGPAMAAALPIAVLPGELGAKAGLVGVGDLFYR
jgi:glucokinase